MSGMKRMIPLILFSVLFLDFSTKAQVNGSSGGGGPTREDLRAICENLHFVSSELEKKFLDEKGLEYKSEKDFINYIDMMIVNEAVRMIHFTQTGKQCKPSLNDGDLTQLVHIRKAWEVGASTAKRHCFGKFSSRLQHLSNLKTLISIYRTNEDQ